MAVSEMRAEACDTAGVRPERPKLVGVAVKLRPFKVGRNRFQMGHSPGS
jgi:hypothetical protein